MRKRARGLIAGCSLIALLSAPVLSQGADRPTTDNKAIVGCRQIPHVQEGDAASTAPASGKKLSMPGSGMAIYVSPQGSDSAPGTFAAPVASLGRARDLIREIRAAGPMAQPITVFLRGGTYRLKEPLRFEAQDSGTPATPVRYQSYGNETAIISGGEPISGPWRAHSAQVSVTNVGTRRFNSLFVNNRRAVRAREPDQKDAIPYYRIARRAECLYSETLLLPTECYDRFPFRSRELSSTWQHLQDIEVVSLARWIQPRFRLDHVDDLGQLAFVTRNNGDGFSFGFDYDGTDRYYVENFLEGLDSPGEWYLDRTTGDLYYWPMPGQPIESSEFIAPVVGQLLQLGDVPAIENLIRGNYGEYDDPRFGFEEGDFSISVWLYFPTGDANPAWALTKGDVYFTSGWGVANWVEDGSDPIPSVDLFINDGSGPLGVSAGSHARGQWGHFVWTVDRANGVVIAYKDGIFAGTLDLPPTFGGIGANFPLKIGGYVVSPDFAGAMDELRLFARVLAPEEVQTLFAENSYGGAAPVLELSFDGNLVNTAPDPSVGSWYVQEIYVAAPFGQGLNFSSPGGEPITNHAALVHDLTLSGLELAHTDWTLSATGDGGSQFNYLLKNNLAAVAVAGTDVAIKNCRIWHTGMDAVRVFGRRVTVSGSTISDIGATGIVLGSPSSTEYNYKLVASLASDNRIEDNLVRLFGQVFRGSTGITQFVGSGNRITHNRVAHGPYTGIAAGWWSPPDWGSFSGGNLVAYNEIFDVMRTLNDGGGIYLTGTQPGTLIRNNVIHDVVATREHPLDMDPVGTFIWGIYLDGTSAQMLVRDNLIYRTAWGAIMLNAATYGNRNNYVTNNILVDGVSYQVYLNYASADRFERNIVFTTGKAPIFGVNSAEAIGSSDHNLFFSTQSPSLEPEWSAWRSLGFDTHSIVADPDFVSYGNDDFTVPDSSPAVTHIHFVMPNLTCVGPRRRDGERPACDPCWSAVGTDKEGKSCGGGRLEGVCQTHSDTSWATGKQTATFSGTGAGAVAGLSGGGRSCSTCWRLEGNDRPGLSDAAHRQGSGAPTATGVRGVRDSHRSRR
ncbi:MAG: right-handed parallel beta-helix repeat-containing protein [Candidatus Schekmanbacteria bacterium]|nr:right-handed parallel beta-helix repeat-containing protein [Candidatus Schekmanbacteria bacterium]